MLRLKTFHKFHTGIIWTYWVKPELWFRGRSKHVSVGRQRVDIQICSFLPAAAQTLCLWGEVYNGAYSGNADNHHWNILTFWCLRGGGGVRSSESAKIILFLYKMVQVTFKRFCFSDVIKSCFTRAHNIAYKANRDFMTLPISSVSQAWAVLDQPHCSQVAHVSCKPASKIAGH